MRRLCWYVPLGVLACNRPAIHPSVDEKDTSASVHTGEGWVDSADSADTAVEGEGEMIKGIFAPMMLDPELHDFDDPQTIADMGFNTVGLLQYILVGPDGVVMEGWTDEEITTVVQSFQAVGLDVSLGLGMGYSKTGDIDDLLRVTNYPAEGVEPEPVLAVLGDYFLSMVPLAEELDIAILSVNETDLSFYETNSDGTPDFSVVSAWSQQIRVDMEAAGWGDEPDELLLWKTGYGYVPFMEHGVYQSIDVDMSGYPAAGFSIAPENMHWQEDVTAWAEGYRAHVDRYIQTFTAAMPSENTWPSISEFGVWDFGCGFWNEDKGPCELYWTEEHIAMAFTTVYEAIADWNATQEPKLQAAFAMNSPVRSGQFEWASSERVQEAIAAGIALLD